MSSPIVSASDAGTRTAIKGISTFKGRPLQSCDLIIQLDHDFQLSIELSDLNLSMLGTHQLQNAVTATCTALCLCNQGWRISDGSIRDGLENTSLQGRTQFLTSKEAETLGLPGSTVLLDGGRQLEAVFLTEADIAGGTSRTTSASVLRDCCMQASKELGIKVLHNRMAECRKLFEDKFICSARDSEHEIIVAA